MARVIVYKATVKVGSGSGSVFSFDTIPTGDYQLPAQEGQATAVIRVLDCKHYVIEVPGPGATVQMADGVKRIKDPLDQSGNCYMTADSVVQRARNRVEGFRVIS